VAHSRYTGGIATTSPYGRGMRFVEWNCAGGFDRDLPRLVELGCDLAVLCEVPEVGPPASSTDPAVDWRWTGGGSAKGLALASFGGKLAGVDNQEDRGSLAIAGTDSTGIGVLGIWAWQPKGSTYGAQVTNTVTAYSDWLCDTPSIVAGDFNLIPSRSEDTKSDVLRELVVHLDGLGYKSAYHHFFAEEYGSETRPTYFHHFKEAAPFHIDFCYIHKSLLPQIKSVEVGTYDGWVARVGDVAGHSDHVPMIVDLDI
jgi:hypothetical protein